MGAAAFRNTTDQPATTSGLFPTMFHHVVMSAVRSMATQQATYHARRLSRSEFLDTIILVRSGLQRGT